MRASALPTSGLLGRGLPVVGGLIVGLLTAACGGGEMQSADERQARIDEMYAGYQDEFPEVRDIEAAELHRDLAGASPPVLVDVRTDEERAVSIIPGALSRQEFEARREELSGRPVVTYCTIGYRSGLYADELASQGWDVHNLRGSILSWTHEGGELESAEGPTRRVHVYGRRWNLVADGFEAVW